MTNDRDQNQGTNAQVEATIGLDGAKVKITKKNTKHPILFALVFTLVGAVIYVAFQFLISLLPQFIRPTPTVVGIPKKLPGLTVLAVFPDSPVAQDVKRGLFLSKNPIESLSNGVSLVLQPEYDTPEETGRFLLRFLKENKNIIMVVGHETSTMAKYILENVYENAAFKGTPIPVILPAVTNPTITDVRANSQYQHILRVPATDDVQVATIEDFIGSSKNNLNSTALIVDETNLEYSSYIAKSLIYHAPAYIIDSVGVGLSSNGFAPSRFLSSSPYSIVFIGMKTQAQIFLNQLVLRKKKDKEIEEQNISKLGRSPTDLIPTGPSQILFTDGVVSTDFNETVKILAPPIPIYFTGPIILEDSQHKKESEIISSDLSFRLIGSLTRALIEQLIKKAYENNNLNRRGILSEMNKLKDLTTPILLKVGGRQYPFNFNSQGDSIESPVHLFKVVNGKIYHSELCNCLTKTTMKKD